MALVRPSRPSLCGFILAAGYGTRLQPLTHFLPKPLLPVAGVPVGLVSLDSLIEAGCTEVAVNLHHLSGMIQESFGDRYSGNTIIYSHESAIRGTFGALYPLKTKFIEADNLLLVNGDTFCYWPWEDLIACHLESRAQATLLVHDRKLDPSFGGGIGSDSKSRVVSIRDRGSRELAKRQSLFAGAHVISRELLKKLEDRSGDIFSELYIPLLEQGGDIRVMRTDVPWFDLGTPARYLQANIEIAYSGLMQDYPSAQSPKSVLKREYPGCAISTSASVGPRVTLEDSVVLENSTIPDTCRVERSIIGPLVHLPKGSIVQDKMVTCVLSSWGQPDPRSLQYLPIKD